MLSGLFKKNKDKQQSDRRIFIVLLAFAIAGLLSSAVLSVEKLHLLEDPNASLSCNFNVFLNCASVMKTDQASVFWDIPNSYLGMIGFSAAIAFAVMLLAGIKDVPRWIFIAAQSLYGAGWVFALWLFFQSVFVIQVLCPWCLIVTFSTTILFFAMLRYNLRENTFQLDKSHSKKVQEWIKNDYDILGVAVLVFILIFTALYKFRDGIFG